MIGDQHWHANATIKPGDAVGVCVNALFELLRSPRETFARVLSAYCPDIPEFDFEHPETASAPVRDQEELLAAAASNPKWSELALCRVVQAAHLFETYVSSCMTGPDRDFPAGTFRPALLRRLSAVLGLNAFKARMIINASIAYSRDRRDRVWVDRNRLDQRHLTYAPPLQTEDGGQALYAKAGLMAHACGGNTGSRFEAMTPAELAADPPGPPIANFCTLRQARRERRRRSIRSNEI